MDRRVFLRRSVGMWALGAGLAAGETKEAAKKPPVCVFSKHLQFLDYKELASVCKGLGLDGVDLTVRKGGHVLPENVARDLPAAVDAIRAEGLEVPMITTPFKDGEDPALRPVLETASKLGIRFFRIGGHKYDADGAIPPQLDRFTEELRSLAAVASEYGMTAGYHNHSGLYNVGAPLWDLYRVFEQVGSPNLGSNFDVGHATVEGGYGGWQINARLMAPHVKMMAVKDFVWKPGESRPEWVPLGEGVADTAGCLKIMRAAGFHGPISLHFEYKVQSNEAMIEEIGEAVPVLRGYLETGGY